MLFRSSPLSLRERGLNQALLYKAVTAYPGAYAPSAWGTRQRRRGAPLLRAPPERCAWRAGRIAGCSPRPVERLARSGGAPAQTSTRRVFGGASCRRLLARRCTTAGAPGGQTGARAPGAAHGSRLRLKASTATARGGPGAKAQTGAPRSEWKPTQEAGARGGRPTLRAAQRSAPLRGCRGCAPRLSGCGLAAQPAAGAAQRRRLTSRCADRSAAGWADWRTV